MLRDIAQIISPIITVGLFVIYIGLIVRRRRMLGPAAPLHDRRWFLDIYRRGWGNIMRCRWVLWLPLLMVIIASAEGKIRSILFMRNNPELQKQLEHIQSQRMHRESLIEYIKSLYHFLPLDFFSAAGQLAGAVFSPLHSFTVMALFLLAVMVILLNPQRLDLERTDKVTVKRKKLLAILSGSFGIILFISSAWVMRSQWQNPMEWTWSWLYLPVFVLPIFVHAFGYTTFFHAIDAAEEGRKESFGIAVHEGIAYFDAVLFFLLIITGISLIGDLLTLFPAKGATYGRFYFYFSRIKTILFFMISFIPLLVVIKKIPLRTAFDRCITLWARNWKNLLALTILGTLLLLVPVIFQGRLTHLLGTELAGAVGLLVLAVKTGLGAWILSTFVVFIKAVEE